MTTTMASPWAKSIASSLKHRVSSTPGTMVVYLVATSVAALLFYFIIVFAVHEQRQALTTVCKDSVPSIVAAQHIKAALGDMDASVANELLTPGGKSQDAIREFSDQRKDMFDNLVTAAENISFGDAERRPIKAIINEFCNFEDAVDSARMLHQQGDKAYFGAYADASSLLHTILLGQADALDAANADALEDAYGRQHKVIVLSVSLVVVGSVLLLGSLLATQIFMVRRFRRRLNAGLLVATVAGGLLAAWTVHSLVATTIDLKVAKEDAFSSIHSLWKARSEAYDANSAESRWLLAKSVGDPRAEGYQRDFLKADSDLASMPSGESVKSVAASVAAGKMPTGFGGLLAEEFGNVTFPGEREAATKALMAYLQYRDIDGQIRELENKGHHAEAVELCCGSRPGQSNYAFGQFDEALGQTIDINTQQFQAAYDDGMARLRGYEYVAAALLVLAAVASYVGLRPRLAEYLV